MTLWRPIPAKKTSLSENSIERSHHDEAYKNIFSHPVTVEDLLRGFVREGWVEEIDFPSLKTRSSSFINPDLNRRTGDLLWEATLRDRKVFVLLMFEFQSRVDRWMAVRIMNYTALLYRDLLKTPKESLVDRRLPLVFPIVIYNGARRWTAPCNICELIHAAPAGLESYRPSVSFFLMDTGRLEQEELPSQNLVSAIVRLERISDPESLHTITRDLLSLKGPQYESVLQAFSVWIRDSIRKRLGPGETIPELRNLEEVDAMLNEGIIPWTVKAREEGREEGMRHTRSLVRRILTRRFGPTPEWVERRLAGADISQLEIWADRLFDADAIEDVFLDG